MLLYISLQLDEVTLSYSAYLLPCDPCFPNPYDFPHIIYGML